MLHLAGHDSFLDPFSFEETDHLSQLANADPGEPIAHLLEFGIGLFINRGDGERDAGSPRALGDEKRKFAVPGYKSVPHNEDLEFGIANCEFCVRDLEFQTAAGRLAKQNSQSAIRNSHSLIRNPKFAISYLITPRLELSMKSTSTSTSAHAGASSRICSIAWLVFSFE